MDVKQIRDAITAALKEDIGSGDITTERCIDPKTLVKGEFLAKEDGVLCGWDFVREVFLQMDPEIHLTLIKGEGAVVRKGELLAVVEGPARGILTGERTALNFLQHLSGIATRTASAVNQVAGTKARILDTRKTTPGLRAFEKYGVIIGGGENHRFGLADGILIKDNHIKGAGSIRRAVDLCKSRNPLGLLVEVETSTMAEVEEALDAGVDIIMLDNMTLEEMREAVERIAGRALTEASGNMGEKDLLAVARTGVNRISIGALTNAVKGLDISLKFR